jgi:hypothetical protein
VRLLTSVTRRGLSGTAATDSTSGSVVAVKVAIEAVMLRVASMMVGDGQSMQLKIVCMIWFRYVGCQEEVQNQARSARRDQVL